MTLNESIVEDAALMWCGELSVAGLESRLEVVS